MVKIVQYHMTLQPNKYKKYLYYFFYKKTKL